MKKIVSGRVKSVLVVLTMLAMIGASADSMAAKSVPQSRVNLNTASVDQLMEVPGIGEVKANAIVSHRKSVPFSKIDDLVEVRGIGDKLMAKISPYVTVSAKSGTAGGGGR